MSNFESSPPDYPESAGTPTEVEPLSAEAVSFMQRFRRVEDTGVNGTTCYEERDETGKVIGRVWIQKSREIIPPEIEA